MLLPPGSAIECVRRTSPTHTPYVAVRVVLSMPSVSYLLLHGEGESEAHCGEGGAASPHDPGAGRGRPCALDASSDPGVDMVGLSEGFGRIQALLGGERVEDVDLHVGKHGVGRQVRMLPPEQRQEQDAPDDDEIDSRGAGDADGGAVGEFLDLAAGLQDAVPILDAPTAGIEFDYPLASLGGVHGEGGQEQPLDRIDALRLALLPDQHRLQARRGLARYWRPVGASSTVRARNTSVALRLARPGGAGRLLRFGRAVSRSIATTVRAHAGRRAHGFEERRPAGHPAPTLGAHQEIGFRLRELLFEPNIDVRFAVRHADQLAAPELPGQFRAVPKPSLQRAVLMPSRRFSASFPGGASKRAPRTPRGTPADELRDLATYVEAIRKEGIWVSWCGDGAPEVETGMIHPTTIVVSGSRVKGDGSQ